MDAKKFLLATLAGGITLFAAGAVLYGVLLRDFMAANSAPGFMKEVPDMPLLILGELFIAAFLTLILIRWPGITSFCRGSQGGG